ncbi:low-specificity L-threonine aldolase [Massilia sp. W12]|uniref:low-specificity L-threonine aldolase n=1 Tax=Massilia sp. W12 TaxID=3126507 RepID=UPI0030D5637F
MIDLRSDTVTRPSPAMRAVIAAAEVGDDVWGDDPGVQRLQEYAAEMFGFAAALFAPSGTQTNLIALLTHCERGDEYIVGQEAHTYRYEGGGAAVLGSIQPQPLPNQADGSIALGDIEAAIKPPDFHFARSRLLALENTIGGRVLPPAYVAAALKLAQHKKLATHLDGARICNAAVKLEVAPRVLTQGFDSVSLCLSKGLGAPIGSLLLGGTDFIERAKRWRKMLGGGMRQAGMMAAGGLYALQHNVARLAEDHENAQLLAQGLAQIEELQVDMPQTNIVYCRVPQKYCAELGAYLREQGVLISIAPLTRMVTHLDLSRADVLRVIELYTRFFVKR